MEHPLFADIIESMSYSEASSPLASLSLLHGDGTGADSGAQSEKKVNFCRESAFMTILIFCGKALIQIGEDETLVWPGDVFLIREGCSFALFPENETDIFIADYQSGIMDNLFLSQISDCPLIYDFLRLLGDKDEFLYFDCHEYHEMFHYARILLMELSTNDAHTDKMVRCATVQFLTAMHRIHRKYLVVSRSSMMKSYLVGDMIRYIANHYQTITLSAAAEHFHYHPAYFSTLFQKLAKCSFSRKLLEIRLERSRYLLLSTDLPVEEICLNLGFREKSYFYRQFKKEYGMTPGAFRKKRLN